MKETIIINHEQSTSWRNMNIPKPEFFRPFEITVQEFGKTSIHLVRFSLAMQGVGEQLGLSQVRVFSGHVNI